MEEKKTRAQWLGENLCSSVEQAGAALTREGSELGRKEWMPALFALYTAASQALLGLTPAEEESIWAGYDGRVQALVQAGELEQGDLEEMEKIVEGMADAIVDSCTMLLGRGGENNPLSAALKGAAKYMELDYDLLTRTAGVNLADFLAAARKLP